MGIIHRDIKPANIMLLGSGETKVMDFGIAKLQARFAHLTSTGQLLGTPLYMSPEQALGRPLDGRSDLFSLGVVTHHLLTGMKLFDADSVPRLVTKIAYEEGRPASELVPGLPPGVDQLMSRLLAKPPERRYADGLELAEDAEDILAGRSLRHAGSAAPIGETTTVSTAAIPPASSAPVDATTAAASPPPTATAPRESNGFWKLVVVGILVFGAGLFSARAVWRSGDEGGASEVAEHTAAEATRPRAIPTAKATPRPTPKPTPTPAPQAGPATLRVDFQHHYKSGSLTVFVDKKRVLRESLGGDVKADVAGIEFRKGRIDSTLEVKAGRHDVWVEVRWDDNHRSGGLSGTFRAGRVKTLHIRIDRFLKKMSLEWR